LIRYNGVPEEVEFVRARTTASAYLQEIPMTKWSDRLKRFLKAEDGPTAVEYAVMLALIVVVCITAITTLGTNANATFSNVSLNTAAGS
jgi:pilus assembly protein Flp/PilA